MSLFNEKENENVDECPLSSFSTPRNTMIKHLPPFQSHYHHNPRVVLRISIAFLAILPLLIMSTSVLAAKQIAFVVGIETYENLGPEDQLDNPVRDAKAVSQSLRNLGFDVIEGINLTISEFDDKWQKVLDKTTSKDTLVFFFSGHGVEVDGENLLLPRDIPYFKFGRHKKFQRRSVSVTDLFSDLRTGDRQPPKVTIMILDACRDNPTIPSEYKKGFGRKEGLAEIPKARGSFIMYSAAPGKISLDRLGANDQHPNSVYTRILLPLIEQLNLSIQDMAIKVRELVYTLTQEADYEQIPEYTDGIIGRFCLAGCQGELDIEEAKKYAEQEAKRREKGKRTQKELEKLISKNLELEALYGTENKEEFEYDSVYRLPSDGTPIYLSLAFPKTTHLKKRVELWLGK